MSPGPRLRLVLLSALMLFVELALIRWTGSNVLYLSYFSNFVLLGSFLGIGLGFLRARSPTDLSRWAPVALAFFVGFVLLFPVEVDRSGSELIFFGTYTTSGLPVYVMLPAIFVAVAAVMGLIAEAVGRAFAVFPSLEAYRLDITGSLLGIVAFSALSLFWAPPVAWGIVAAVAFAMLLRGQLRPIGWVACIGLVVMLGRESLLPNLSWSPYYRISMAPALHEPSVTVISVNGILHQAMMSTADRVRLEPVYSLSYAHLVDPDLGRVLIIGAGNGNDVATALSLGADHVDAVEIDPRLLQIGERLHPDNPYADARVTAVVDDGRAFLERTDATYDLIVFALPDSLTLVAGQSSIRLESYLFTQEAMESARAHLAPGGVFTMYNFYRERWLVDRFATTLQTAFGAVPCLDDLGAGQLAALTVAVDSAALTCPTPWVPSGPVSDIPPPATDDHPFPYLRQAQVPAPYLLTIGLILVASLLAVRGVAGSLRPMTRYLDLAAMGAAFLLLETKNVVQFALLFGTTWFVNALVFAGVLLSVLAAIEVARRLPSGPPADGSVRRGAMGAAWPLYALLLASVAVAWLIPPEALLRLDVAPRFAASVAVAFTPIFLANLVFAQRFRDVGDSTTAFGANLVGAMVGGLIEYAALLTGYQALLLVVALLYGVAFVVGRRATA